MKRINLFLAALVCLFVSTTVCHADDMPIPAALVPASIQQYVKATFSGASVVKIDKERHGYDVELSNGVELKFNHQGAFIGYDD
jgi:hypothetical protein